MATLVATPFTIRLLGPAQYGVWALLLPLLTYLGLADLGMASASTYLAGRRHQQADASGEANAIFTCLVVTVGLSALASLVVAGAAPFLVSSLLHVPATLSNQSVLAMRVLAAGVVASSASGTVNTPQVVRLRWRELTLATQGPALVRVAAAPLALAASSGGIVAVAYVYTGANLLALGANLAVALRLQPRLARPHFDRALLPLALRYGGALAISGFAAIPLLSAERIFLAHWRSPSAVAPYAVAMTLASMAAVLPTIVMQPLFPGLVRAGEDPSGGAVREIYLTALRGAFLLLSPAVLALAFLGHPFLAAWAGPLYARQGTLPFYILLGAVWLNALAGVPYNYLLASGRTRLIARTHVAELIPYLALAAVLTATWGAVGAAIAWATRATVDSAVFFTVAHRAGDLPWKPTPARPVAALATLFGLAGSLLAVSAVTSSLVGRAIWVCGLLLVTAALTWRYVLTTAEQGSLRRVVQALRSGARAAHA